MATHDLGVSGEELLAELESLFPPSGELLRTAVIVAKLKEAGVDRCASTIRQWLKRLLAEDRLIQGQVTIPASETLDGYRSMTVPAYGLKRKDDAPVGTGHGDKSAEENIVKALS